MRRFFLLSIFLFLFSSAFALNMAERMALMCLCTLAEDEAESSEQLTLLAAHCLIREGRIDEAIKRISGLKAEAYREAASYLLRGLSIELEYGGPTKRREPEKRPSPEEVAVSLFYSGNYSGFFETLESNPELLKKPEIRKLLALVHYRTGRYALALAVLAPYRDPFSCFWRWKIKRKLALNTEEEENCLAQAPLTDFYGALYRAMTGKRPTLKLLPPAQGNRCPSALILQKSGLDARSLDALKDCAASRKDWFHTIPLLPNPNPGIKLLYALKTDWRTRLSYSYIRPFLAEVRLACWAYEVDEDLAYAVMRQESLFNRYALSTSGAMGLMQILPKTAVWISGKKLNEAWSLPKYFIPFFSVKYGIWYLGHLGKRFGDIMSIAAYNSGPTRLKKWLDENPWVEDVADLVEFYPVAETRAYVKKVLVNYYIYRFIL